MKAVKRILMTLVVLGGVVSLMGFFLPWIDAGSSPTSLAHISGWQIYGDFGRVFTIAAPAGAAVAIIFGLAGVLFPGLEVLKGLALSGAVAAAVFAAWLYFGINESPAQVGLYIGGGWAYIKAGYGLIVSLAGAGAASLLSIIALAP